MKPYEISDQLKEAIATELKEAPNKKVFHARLQKEVYPTIKGTTILHENNKIEIYHYD